MWGMSEAIFAEVHETEHTVEVRWDYGGRIYGIVMSQEMFDLLEISSGQQTPALVKLSIGLDHPAWSGGVVLTDDGFTQKTNTDQDYEAHRRWLER